MPTAIINYEAKVWKLAATGPVTVILSSNGRPFQFILKTSTAIPTETLGHVSDAISTITFDVKTGEYLFVMAEQSSTVVVSAA